MFYYLAFEYYVILRPGLFQSVSVCTIVVMGLVQSFCLFHNLFSSEVVQSFTNMLKINMRRVCENIFSPPDSSSEAREVRAWEEATGSQVSEAVTGGMRRRSEPVTNHRWPDHSPPLLHHNHHC